MAGKISSMVFAVIMFCGGAGHAGSHAQSGEVDIVALYYNATTGSVAEELEARGILRGLSRERLSEFENSIDRGGAAEHMRGFIQQLLKEKYRQEFFVLNEALFVEHIPLPFHRPHYEHASGKPHIRELHPEAEHFYMSNLKPYPPKRSWLKKDEQLYVRQDGQDRSPVPFAEKTGVSIEGLFKSIWDFDRGADTTTAYFIDYRQWIKRYAEPPIMPVVKGAHIFLRDEYFIRCLDRETGREIWQMGADDKQRPDLYQTFHPPHQNAYGFGLGMGQDMLFAELYGTLVAVSVEDATNPMRIWQRSLGEFRAVTTPVVFGEQLVLGAINSAGELWVLGFSLSDGDVLWTEHVGLSSHLSPVSLQTAKDDSHVYLGTNHGALVAVAPEQGGIAWIRTYAPNTYSLFDYWLQQDYADIFAQQGSIMFTGMVLATTSQGFLVYKPRESADILFLNPATGQLVQDMYLGEKKYLLLGICRGNVVLYKQQDAETAELIVVDPHAKKVLFEEEIASGVLYGALVNGANSLIYKIGGTMYHFSCEGDVSRNTVVGEDIQGWLLGQQYSGELLLLQEDRITCFKDGDSLHRAAESGMPVAESIRKFIELCSVRSLSGDDFTAALADFCRENLISREKFLEYAANMPDAYEGPQGKKIAALLREEFSDAFVTHQNISLRGRNFFDGITGRTEVRPAAITNGGTHQTAIESYSAQGGESVYLLPVTKTDERAHIDFYLVLNHDQLMCVGEAGDIRWATRVFYNPLDLKGIDVHADADRLRMYADHIEAYVAHDVVIVNDGVNVCSFDLSTGELQWSMTTADEYFSRIRVLPYDDDSSLYKKRGISKVFVDSVAKHVLFMEGELFVIYRGSISRVDPVTGFSEKTRHIDVSGFLSVTGKGALIYLVDSDLKNMYLLNERLEVMEVVALNFLEEDEVFVAVHPAAEYIYVQTDSHVYAIEKTTHSRSRLTLPKKGENDRWYLEVRDDVAVVILPLDSMSAYSIQAGEFLEKWSVGNNASRKKLFATESEPTGKQSAFYYAHRDTVYFLQNREGLYFLSAREIHSGNMLWEVGLPLGGDLFYNLSPALFDDDRKSLRFIISRNQWGMEQPSLLRPEITSNHIRSWFMEICTADGSIRQQEELPKISGYRRGFKRPTLVSTERVYAYTVHGSFLKVISR